MLAPDCILRSNEGSIRLGRSAGTARPCRPQLRALMRVEQIKGVAAPRQGRSTPIRAQQLRHQLGSGPARQRLGHHGWALTQLRQNSRVMRISFGPGSIDTALARRGSRAHPGSDLGAVSVG